MRIKVFIENESGSNEKHLHDEKSLTYQETMLVSRNYPYPYGFILNTTSGDGDNVDVFVITDHTLHSGEIVTCEVIGLMEQFEKSWDSESEEEEVDHNVLARLIIEDVVVNDSVKAKLTDFVLHVFDDVQAHKVRVGEFLGVEEADQFIAQRKDSIALRVLNKFRSIPSIKFMVCIYFFFTWCFVVDYFGLHYNGYFIAFGILFPFALLVGVLRYKNKVSYGIVMAIFIIHILAKIRNISYSLDDFSTIIYRSTNNLFDIIFPLLALALMHNRRMTAHYNWTTKWSFVALIVAWVCSFILRRYVAHFTF